MEVPMRVKGRIRRVHAPVQNPAAGIIAMVKCEEKALFKCFLQFPT